MYICKINLIIANDVYCKYTHRELTSIKDHNLIRVHDGVQAMGNGQHSAILKFVANYQLDESVSSILNRILRKPNISNKFAIFITPCRH